MGKRLFEILDQINQDDAKKGTQNVALANAFISANKVKAGCHITMGAPESFLHDIMNEKKIPILMLIDKKEYDKLTT